MPNESKQAQEAIDRATAVVGDDQPPSADPNRPSLRDRDASQIRNEQRGGDAAPIDPDADPGPEGNATMRRVWSQPGGEAENYRNAMIGAGGNTDNHSDLVASETPAETIRHLGDATLSPDDKDATAEAIARMGKAGQQKR